MRAFILCMALSLAFLGMSLRAIRRRLLREQSAVLWLGVSIVMVIMSATLPIHLLDHVARLVGIAYPPDLILLLGILFLVILVFHLSISFARLHQKHTALVQEIGILQAVQPSSKDADSSQDSELSLEGR
jgi:hypothetical protein